MSIKDESVAGVYAQQIADMSKTISALKSKVAYLENEIAERDKIPVPRSVVLQLMKYEQQKRNMIEEFKRKENKLKNDIEYFKKYVPVQVIINKESKDKPVREGGVAKMDGGMRRVTPPPPVLPQRKTSGIPKGTAKKEEKSKKQNFGAMQKAERPEVKQRTGSGIPKKQ